MGQKLRLARLVLVSVLFFGLLLSCGPSRETGPVQLRLGVSLTPQELASFQPALQALDEAHPEWTIVLETTPQSGFVEKINTQLAGNALPDVVRVQGLFAQQWIRQDAFLELGDRIEASGVNLDDFYLGPLAQFQWKGKLWGLPDSAAPDIVFYNKDMFDEAGLAYPTDDWTYEDMRQAAILLTKDARGLRPVDPGFNPEAVEQWGWNGGFTFFWQRHLVRALGGELCSNEDCTLMRFTSPETLAAAEWWARLVNEDHAALHDPYGGSQTGVPGDPFIAGKAAMGYNGFFAVGQLNEAGSIDYDIVQPLVGVDGQRYTPVSTNGYVISARSQYPDEAWNLVLALLEPSFLAETWGEPGHSIPARRSAAGSAVSPSRPPANQGAIVEAMEYGEVFKPHTASAFEVYGKTSDLFLEAMKGDIPVGEAMEQIEAIANEILARDRHP